MPGNNKTQYEFDFVFDGEKTLKDLLTDLTTERILCKIAEISLPKTKKVGYNTPTVSALNVPGLREEAT